MCTPKAPKAAPPTSATQPRILLPRDYLDQGNLSIPVNIGRTNRSGSPGVGVNNPFGLQVQDATALTLPTIQSTGG